MNSPRQNPLLFFLALSLLVLVTGCGSTKFTASWQPEGMARPVSVNKVFVAVLTSRLAARQAAENEIVRMFEASKIEARASINEYGPNFRLDSNKTAEITRDLTNKNFDAALVVSVQDVEKSQRYVPGSTYPAGFYGYGWGYYYPYYGRVYEPGYYTNTTTVFLLTDLFDLRSKELIWTGQTQSLDPSSLNSFVREYAKALRSRLKADKAIDL